MHRQRRLVVHWTAEGWGDYTIVLTVPKMTDHKKRCSDIDDIDAEESNKKCL